MPGALIPSVAIPSPTTRAAILGVLEQLLAVGVTDSDHRVRRAVLTLLVREPRLDPFLSQNDTIQSLFVALNDEQPEIREIVICLLGRLSALNPAFILPSLRRTLILVLFNTVHITLDSMTLCYCYCYGCKKVY